MRTPPNNGVHGQPGKYHLQESVAASAGVFIICVVEFALTWRTASSEYTWPLGAVVLVFGYTAAIAILVTLTVALKDLRERALPAIAAFRLSVGFLAGLFPETFKPAAGTIRDGSRILWLACCLISFSILVSATRNPARNHGTPAT
jgi:hypothetical protein